MRTMSHRRRKNPVKPKAPVNKPVAKMSVLEMLLTIQASGKYIRRDPWTGYLEHNRFYEAIPSEMITRLEEHRDDVIAILCEHSDPRERAVEAAQSLLNH